MSYIFQARLDKESKWVLSTMCVYLYYVFGSLGTRLAPHFNWNIQSGFFFKVFSIWKNSHGGEWRNSIDSNNAREPFSDPFIRYSSPEWFTKEKRLPSPNKHSRIRHLNLKSCAINSTAFHQSDTGNLPSPLSSVWCIEWIEIRPSASSVECFHPNANYKAPALIAFSRPSSAINST